MLRKIIKIDDSKCDGCELCIPSCAEGAIQIIDGKARLISDLFCDGLGACIGHCPQGAITIEEREAEPYNERKVMEYIVKGGSSVIQAHLEHLYEHNEIEYLNEAFEFLKEKGIEYSFNKIKNKNKETKSCCNTDFVNVISEDKNYSGTRETELINWPIQLHLISPFAEYFQGADVLLAADCVAFSYGEFHRDFLKGKSLLIACPKLDSNKEIYLQKLITLINQSLIKSLSVVIMQVPCCGGLYRLATQAINESERKIPLKLIVISIDGKILQENIVN